MTRIITTSIYAEEKYEKIGFLMWTNGMGGPHNGGEEKGSNKLRQKPNRTSRG